MCHGGHIDTIHKGARLQHDSALAASLKASRRHYGMDWLRIAAFALLIVYHVAMVFAPWDWIIHTPRSYAALTIPMALLTPWRLPLLFAVSGYASRKLYERSAGAGAFARSRALRLLVPLGFGMAVIVPPEMWVRVMEGGYSGSYLQFWAVDYWRWEDFHGVEFPSWEHLWFVAYLATYSFVLAGALALGGAKLLAVLHRCAAWFATGGRLLWVPIAVLIVLRLAVLFVVPERQGLARDWSSHVQFLPVFVAGFVFAGTPQLWPAVHRLWKSGLAIAALAGLAVSLIELRWPGSAVPPHDIMALDRACRVAMAWGMIVALFHLAERHWNRDHKWRKPLAEAVFPFYIVHHPAIVLIAWYSLPLGLPPLAEFALLLLGTVAACLAVYLIGRQIGWLRPLIGLGSKPAAIAPASAQHRPAL